MSIVFVLSFPSPVSFGVAPSSPSTLNLATCGLVGVPKTLGGVDGVVVCVGAALADASPPSSTDACNSLSRVVEPCAELRSPVNTYRAASVALRGVAVIVLSTCARIAETPRPFGTFSTSSNPNAAANCMRSRSSPLLSVPCVRGRASRSVDRVESNASSVDGLDDASINRRANRTNQCSFPARESLVSRVATPPSSRAMTPPSRDFRARPRPRRRTFFNARSTWSSNRLKTSARFCSVSARRRCASRVSSEAANEATGALSIDRRGLDADGRRIARESRYGGGGVVWDRHNHLFEEARASSYRIRTIFITITITARERAYD